MIDRFVVYAVLFILMLKTFIDTGKLFNIYKKVKCGRKKSIDPL